MKKFYLHNGSNMEGPFSYEELAARGIAADTQVWLHSTPTWRNAGEIDELKPLFTAHSYISPVGIPNHHSSGVANNAKENGIRKGLLYGAILIVIILLALYLQKKK